MQHSVAVIIPTYNRRETLGRALNSVLAQTRMPDEICVVDDGSDDGTEDFIRHSFPSVDYVYQSNRGVSAARNAGVAKTCSNWLAFLDSDDEWLEDKLSIQLQSIADNGDVNLVHCDEIWIRNGVRVNQMHKHEKAGGDIFERCLPLCMISPSAVMLRRGLFEEVGGFDEDLPACEDYDLWLKISSRYPVHYIDQPLLRKYGGHDDQLSRQFWGMDRFRVQALARLLDASVLSDAQQQAARLVLQDKCEILINGARKHENETLLESCLAIVHRYELKLMAS